ncbi:prenyltransferase/squalene oxidase repeat-containing protein [Streptomyces wedmorensis]
MRVQRGMEPVWPTDDFPERLDASAEVLRAAVERSVMCGSEPQRWRCCGRVLESVLMLVLLRRTGLEAAAAARLESFLRRGQAGWTAVDALLARVALGGPGGRVVVEEFLREAPAFQSGSKREMIDAVLCLAGAAVDPRPPSPRGVLHPAGRAQTTAVTVILRKTATEGEAAILAAVLEHESVWEGNLLVHLLAANALSLLPDYSGAVAAAVRKALTHERGDGGLPFVTDLGVWCAVTAGIALAHTATPRRSLYDLADRLTAGQCDDGGWSYAAGARHSDTDDTAVAVEFLHILDAHRYRTAVDRALDRLTCLQGDDGGLATYMPGALSEAGMTAAALNAFSCRPAQHLDRIRAGLDFLARAQQADGLFAPEWSRSRYHVAFRVLLAAAAAPSAAQTTATADMARRLGDAVRRGQNPDGGWSQQQGERSDAISTAYALICLTVHGDPTRAAAGARYLLSTQTPEGHITSTPDLVGTRPFLFDIPALADHAALLALAHLQARLRAPKLPPH